MTQKIAFRVAGLAVTILMSEVVFAQADWTQRFPAHSPIKRLQPAMAQFGDGNAVVMFGGLNLGTNFLQTNVLGDTWIWNGSDWSQFKTTLVTPPARYGASMAYDPATGKALLFGGTGAGGQVLSDTWLFTFSCTSKTNCVDRWTQLTFAAGASPPARNQASMSYDPAFHQIVLTGGFGPSGALQDTWYFQPSTNTWTGHTGTAQSPIPSRIEAPLAECRSSIVSGNSRVHYLMLFGGGTSANPLGEAWVYLPEVVNGQVENDWKGPFFTGEARPSPRTGHGMAYYPTSNFDVLYGGQGLDGQGDAQLLSDTFNGDCGSFSNNGTIPNWLGAMAAHNPGPRWQHGMATGPGGFTVLMFGGSDLVPNEIFPLGRDRGDTWTWGRRAACVPADGSNVPVGSEVSCQFDAAAGIQFGDWVATGFAPPAKDELTTKFHTEAPGTASITAMWTEADGSHSQTYNYTITRPH